MFISQSIFDISVVLSGSTSNSRLFIYGQVPSTSIGDNYLSSNVPNIGTRSSTIPNYNVPRPTSYFQHMTDIPHSVLTILNDPSSLIQVRPTLHSFPDSFVP